MVYYYYIIYRLDLVTFWWIFFRCIDNVFLFYIVMFLRLGVFYDGYGYCNGVFFFWVVVIELNVFYVFDILGGENVGYLGGLFKFFLSIGFFFVFGS